MAKRKPEEGSAGSPAWMTTFSDLMNLLLCFFVLLFSMSTIDSEKFQEMAASMAATFSVLPAGGSTVQNEGILVSSGASQLSAIAIKYTNVGLNSEGDVTTEISDAHEEVQKEGLEESEKMAGIIEAELGKENLSDIVEVTANSKYVELNMNGGLLFDSGKAELKADAVSIINRVSDAIKRYDTNFISIEGHTDNVPINSSKFPNNMMLSLHRAYSVYNYMVEEKGFEEKSLIALGRGDTVPIASNATAEGRAQNRRVQIKIYNSFYGLDN